MQSSRSPLRRVLRWTGRIVLSLVVLLAVAAGTVYARSAQLLGEQFAVPEHPIAVHTDSATVARGAHLAIIRGCTDCHGANLRGNVMLDDPAVGRLAGPNLTAGGRGRELTDADWERAVRHGVRRDGSALVIMPANEFNVFTDEDLAAIVAYARSLPADANVAPSTRPGPVMRALHAAGQVPLLPAKTIDHAAPHAARIAVEPTVAYGKYIAVGCQGCHNPSFSGGKLPGTPPDWKPAANITPTGIGHYTEADFVTALRTGRRPDGSMIDPKMPIATMTANMTDTELAALYAYLKTVPAKAYGAR